MSNFREHCRRSIKRINLPVSGFGITRNNKIRRFEDYPCLIIYFNYNLIRGRFIVNMDVVQCIDFFNHSVDIVPKMRNLNPQASHCLQNYKVKGTKLKISWLDHEVILYEK